MNAPQPQLTVRWDIVDALRDLKGLNTDLELATAMGMDPSQISRVRRGASQPGKRFIASLCLALKTSPGSILEVRRDAAA